MKKLRNPRDFTMHLVQPLLDDRTVRKAIRRDMVDGGEGGNRLLDCALVIDQVPSPPSRFHLRCLTLALELFFTFTDPTDSGF